LSNTPYIFDIWFLNSADETDAEITLPTREWTVAPDENGAASVRRASGKMMVRHKSGVVLYQPETSIAIFLGAHCRPWDLQKLGASLGPAMNLCASGSRRIGSKHRTSNIEHPTPNYRRKKTSTFDVGCWALSSN